MANIPRYSEEDFLNRLDIFNIEKLIMITLWLLIFHL